MVALFLLLFGSGNSLFPCFLALGVVVVAVSPCLTAFCRSCDSAATVVSRLNIEGETGIAHRVAFLARCVAARVHHDRHVGRANILSVAKQMKH